MCMIISYFKGEKMKEDRTDLKNNGSSKDLKLPEIQGASQIYDGEVDMTDLTELLKQQVKEELEGNQSSTGQDNKQKKNKKTKVNKKKHKVLKILGIVFAIFLILFALMIGTKSGRKVIYKLASDFIYSNVEKGDVNNNNPSTGNGNTDNQDTTSGKGSKDVNPLARSEDYVTNYVIFGIEEFGGASNTDSMMIASINTKDNTIKLTSLLRDSYVDIPGHDPNKLNAAYSRGGANSLVATIEQNYRIQIDGYASVDFKSFEKIVDYLGGITIELGEIEAHYLNTTNYISNKAYRNVKAGMNTLNGNQVLGYCRVRKVSTLGGANNDYGRIIRQQRVLTAIFNKYKSKNLFDAFKIMKVCLGYVTTDLSSSKIQKAIEDVVENKIKTLDTFRVPVDGSFETPGKYNGVIDPIVLDWEVNRQKLYSYIFLDTKAEAEAALAAQK